MDSANISLFEIKNVEDVMRRSRPKCLNSERKMKKDVSGAREEVMRKLALLEKKIRKGKIMVKEEEAFTPILDFELLDQPWPEFLQNYKNIGQDSKKTKVMKKSDYYTKSVKSSKNC